MAETTTEVVPNARLELLRCLAFLRDCGAGRPTWPRCVPLFMDDWANTDEDILLAARECAAIGEIEFYPDTLIGPTAAITDLGYDRIRAHDTLGEAAQEVSRV